MAEDEKHPYADLLDLPRPVSQRHPRMPRRDRAAQFAPFAALTGYGAVIDEAARLTDSPIALSEEQKAGLDLRLRLLAEALPQRPEARFTYFLPDSRKSGGAYVTAAGRLKRLDIGAGRILLTDGREIQVERLLDLQCPALGLEGDFC